MSARLDHLRAMRDFIDSEIEAELRLLAAPLGTGSAVQRSADLYGVAVADILAGDRSPQVVKARQAAAWLLRHAGMSLPQIGVVLGCHHTTVLNSLRRVDGSQTIRALLAELEVAA